MTVDEQSDERYDVKEDEPEEGEGEFKVHGIVAAEADDRVIGTKKDGGEKINEAEEQISKGGTRFILTFFTICGIMRR